MSDDDKSPLDLALDLFVYAPIGLALAAQEELPKLVEKGRERVTQQVTMARAMGEFTVTQAGRMIGQRLEPRREPAGGPGVSAASPAGGADDVPAAEPARGPTATAAPSAPATATSTNGSAPVAAAPSPDELAIPNYDSLSASQVVPRLAGLSAAELAAVAAYEAATRHRKTILNRVAQLQSGA